MAERQNAVRALVQAGLLQLRDPAFPLVRRHAGWLRDWFQRHLGWSLFVDAESARLFKTPGDTNDTTRGAVTAATNDAQRAPFTRRRYAWLCLALAHLEKADRQTTLGRLAEGLGLLTNEDSVYRRDGMVMDLQEREHRRDLVQVVRKLLAHGVLERIDGNEDQFVQSRGDVLYRINRSRLHLVLSVRRGPSTVHSSDLEERLASITEQMHEDSSEARNRAVRHGINRRLLEDPIVYYAELSGDEMEYWISQRAHLLRHLCEATGLVPELRREGVALADEAGAFTDFTLPQEGTEGHVALLLAEHLAALYRARPDSRIPMAELEATVAGFVGEYGKYWRQDAREPGAERQLLRDAIGRLAALRLLEWGEGWVHPRPALARYSVGTIVRTGAGDEQGALL